MTATVVDHPGETPEATGPHRYRNSERMLAASDPAWQAAAEHGLIDMHVDTASDYELVIRETGHRFVNMCSCSYLGLNSHPKILQGAVDALATTKLTSLSVSATRSSARSRRTGSTSMSGPMVRSSPGSSRRAAATPRRMSRRRGCCRGGRP